MGLHRVIVGRIQIFQGGRLSTRQRANMIFHFQGPQFLWRLRHHATHTSGSGFNTSILYDTIFRVNGNGNPNIVIVAL